MEFRPYQKKDREHCLALFDGNVPHFFNAAERKDFEQFLDQFSGPYFLLENEQGVILGCGGYDTDPDTHIAFLRWGMIAQNQHGTGLGSALLKNRILQIKQDTTIHTIAINTSQNAEGFYQRFGFETTSITKDFFGPGLHLCEMRLTLSR